MLDLSEFEQVEQFILDSGFPSRLRIALYIVGVSNHPDCVNRFEDGKMQCIDEKIYPINRLRNIAIRNVVSSHFVVFDMDMWPARCVEWWTWWIANTYTTLSSLPPSYYLNPYNVMIIPAFSLSKSVLDPTQCDTLQSCVESLFSLLAVMSSVIHHYPNTKEDLMTCLDSRNCTIFRRNPKCHVSVFCLFQE